MLCCMVLTYNAIDNRNNVIMIDIESGRQIKHINCCVCFLSIPCKSIIDDSNDTKYSAFLFCYHINITLCLISKRMPFVPIP